MGGVFRPNYRGEIWKRIIFLKNIDTIECLNALTCALTVVHIGYVMIPEIELGEYSICLSYRHRGCLIRRYIDRCFYKNMGMTFSEWIENNKKGVIDAYYRNKSGKLFIK